MAQAVHPLPFLRSFSRLAHVSPDAAFGIRFATAACAAIWLGHAPGLVESQSKWIMITVLVVSQPVAGGSLMKAILRSAGTLAAFVTAIALFGLFAQDPPLLLAGLFLTQVVGAYGFTGPRNQYAWFVFAFTTAVILGDALSGVDEVETVAFERATMVGLGILVVLVVDALLWPVRSELSVRRSLAERARRLADALRRAVELAREPRDANGEARGSASSPLTAQLTLIDAARTEIGIKRTRVDGLTHVALLLEALASRQRALERSFVEGAAASEWEGLRAPLAELGRGLKAGLEESAEALAAGRAPAPFAKELEQVVLKLEAERARARSRAGTDAALESRTAGLHDLVALLHTLEGALLQLASESARVQAPGSAPAWGAIRFDKLDPFRVQIALRTGIAVCAAVLLAMVLGWKFNNLVPPLAFMMAAAPTRGGAALGVASIGGSVLLAWLLADLAIVYFSPHVGQLPLALAFPFAVAGTFGYVTASRPALDGVRKFATLIALLAVYAGHGAPTDVQGAYDSVCYAALAVGVGWASTRLLWPATAATLFRVRAAAQLALCARALRERDPAAGADERRARARDFLATYTKQLAQLGSLHNQARHEPIEHSLDESRRGELLALTQDLFDAVFAAQAFARGQAEALVERGGAELAPLHQALLRVDEALPESIEAAAASVRDGTGAPPSGLADARDAVEARLAEIAHRPEQQSAPDAGERDAFLVLTDSRRQLVTRQLAIEQWLSGWRGAIAAESGLALVRVTAGEGTAPEPS